MASNKAVAVLLLAIAGASWVQALPMELGMEDAQQPSTQIRAPVSGTETTLNGNSNAGTAKPEESSQIVINESVKQAVKSMLDEPMMESIVNAALSSIMTEKLAGMQLNTAQNNTLLSTLVEQARKYIRDSTMLDAEGKTHFEAALDSVISDYKASIENLFSVDSTSNEVETSVPKSETESLLSIQ